jgi:hypothetical protein
MEAHVLQVLSRAGDVDENKGRAQSCPDLNPILRVNYNYSNPLGSIYQGENTEEIISA